MNQGHVGSTLCVDGAFGLSARGLPQAFKWPCMGPGPIGLPITVTKLKQG